MNRVDRNKILVRHAVRNGIATSQRDLATKMGCNNESYFSQLINEKQPYPKDFSERFKRLIPNLNTHWLETGCGDMLISDQKTYTTDAAILSNNDKIYVNIDALISELNISIYEFCSTIGATEEFILSCDDMLLPKHIMMLQERYGDTIIDKHAKYPKNALAEVTELDNSSAAIPMVTDIVLSKRNVDIKKFLEKNSSELQSIDPYKLFEGAEFAVEMFKDSMAPDIMAGDKVILQFLPKEAKLQSGAMYFINSTSYADVIRDVYIDGDTATLKARNPRYGDIVLSVERDILRIANVLGVYRNTFSSSYAQLEELRRTKDEQLNRFIDMQSEMVAELREQGKRNEHERNRVDRLIDKLIEGK